ncbi:glycosyltransferase family 2 protein [Pedobacter mendelii]|uniref:Glycosyl transferase n=1 Tax=Pedobacter mendelii TaxID=1908240 RepID=A0ABQ2BDI4_9SPHI|nr:glycosyltransferase family 2 protein [Pedobacter mendelii]GGI22895.1 glycosyl transferase [Pedobacter mendelii]
MNKKLSIITVNYNDKAGLEKTINSVKQQTWQDFDYFIIDGGSTDGSADIVNIYKNEFAHCISEPDNGVYNAMNKGIRLATGDYLLFLNSGDSLKSYTTLQEIEVYLNNEKDIYYGDANYQEKDGDVIRTYPDKLSFSFFYKHNLSHQATFIKRNLFENIFFYNENHKIVSDWEFFIYAICKKNVTYKHINQVICNYDTQGISSIINNHELMNIERDKTLQKHFPLFIEDYRTISNLNLKRFRQFTFIKNYPFAFKILKGFMNLILMFLPKFKNLQ